MQKQIDEKQKELGNPTGTPEDMRRYLTRANRGELEVRVRGVQEGGRAVYAVGRQMIYTAIGLFAAYQALESWRRQEVAMARGLCPPFDLES